MTTSKSWRWTKDDDMSKSTQNPVLTLQDVFGYLGYTNCLESKLQLSLNLWTASTIKPSLPSIPFFLQSPRTLDLTETNRARTQEHTHRNYQQHIPQTHPRSYRSIQAHLQNHNPPLMQYNPNHIYPPDHAYDTHTSMKKMHVFVPMLIDHNQ